MKSKEKIKNSSKYYYNLGLEKANANDLTGAAKNLKAALFYDKNDMNARNLLGLVYYQMGDIVPALSQWVISSNLKKEDNAAIDYLKDVQENPVQLDTVNQVIKKYNQALVYAKQGNEDLAMIQLKNVVSMMPNFINAQLLIALLSIKDENYKDAQKALKNVLDVDCKNPRALEYLQETEALLKPADMKAEDTGLESAEGPKKKVLSSVVGKYEELPSNRHRMVYMVGGIVIGVLVSLVLLYPSIKKASSYKYSSKIENYKEQLLAKETQLKSNEKDIKEAKAAEAKAKKELKEFVGDSKTEGIYDSLLTAMQYYGDRQYTESADALLNIDRDKLGSKKMKEIYDDLEQKVYPYAATGLYNKGISAYNQGNYKDAISTLKKAIKVKDTNVGSYFYLARSYEKNGDKDKAIKAYEDVIQKFPGTNSARNSQNYLNQLQNKKAKNL